MLDNVVTATLVQAQRPLVDRENRCQLHRSLFDPLKISVDLRRAVTILAPQNREVVLVELIVSETFVTAINRTDTLGKVFGDVFDVAAHCMQHQ